MLLGAISLSIVGKRLVSNLPYYLPVTLRKRAGARRDIIRFSSGPR
jgi:hypothetical protein